MIRQFEKIGKRLTCMMDFSLRLIDFATKLCTQKPPGRSGETEMTLKDDLVATSNAYEDARLVKEAAGLEAELRNAANHGCKSLFFRTKMNSSPKTIEGYNPHVETFLKAEDLTWKLTSSADGGHPGYQISWD